MRISGRSFNVHAGGTLLHVDKATLNIEDNSQAVKDAGLVNGYVAGDVSASGELELDARNMKLLTDSARVAGGFRALEPADIVFYANTGNDEMKVEAFGCLLKITALLDIDSGGGSKHISRVPFEVTGRDFVRIDGVPYLAPDEAEEF